MTEVYQHKDKRRIHLMDEIRGLALVLMVAYHAFYTIGYIFNVNWGRNLFLFFLPVEAFFAGVFIFICGVSCRLSHSNLKRGTVLLVIALLITLILYIFMPEEIIIFGILHFLSVSILLFALLRPILNHIHPLTGLIICGVLILFTWWIPEYRGGLFGIKGFLSYPVPHVLKQPILYPLGFGDLKSSDYFPILPWIFVFLGGSFFGIWAARGQLPNWMYKQQLPILSKIGKHTLIIYIIHQPVIYAICYFVIKITRAITG